MFDQDALNGGVILNKDLALSILTQAKIKVIGVGGGGCNALNRMIEEEVKVPGIEFIAVNTDIQVLHNSITKNKIQIGKEKTKGTGAGARPNVGKEAAEESIDEIKKHLTGADMIFITATMGGGTGTGAAPVIACLAKKMGILTIAIVTTPFKWEGPIRMRNATNGICELRKYTDIIITLSNQKLLSMLPADIKIKDGFKEADKLLKAATIEISGLIQKTGIINLDFADIKTIMSNSGLAHVGIGYGEGENRAEKAVKEALNSEMLENNNLIKGTKRALIYITGGSDFKFQEMNIIIDAIYKEIGENNTDANIVSGLSIDDNYNGKVQLLLIATNPIQEENMLVEAKDKTPGIVQEMKKSAGVPLKEVNLIREPQRTIKGDIIPNHKPAIFRNEISTSSTLPSNREQQLTDNNQPTSLDKTNISNKGIKENKNPSPTLIINQEPRTKNQEQVFTDKKLTSKTDFFPTQPINHSTIRPPFPDEKLISKTNFFPTQPISNSTTKPFFSKDLTKNFYKEWSNEGYPLDMLDTNRTFFEG
ncbi:MAG: cell division protein FtsZ [bacterium]